MSRITCSADELARRLGGTPRGDYHSAPCPAHDDDNPSLSIWTADQGVALKCHAGCSYGAIMDAIKAQHPDVVEDARKGKRRARIVATYDYRDADGALLGQVVRLEPKSFRQRRPDPSTKSGWSWRMQGVQLPVYRLPEVVGVPSVVVAEGEKDVDALWSIGIPATCNPGGAGKWRDIHTEALRGKRVCIIQDKDGAGRSHGRQVADALLPVAETVRVMEAPDPHKDPADWIDGGVTREQILKAIRSTPSYNPVPVAEPVDIDRQDDPDTAPSWRTGLLYSDQGAVRALLANAMHAMRWAPDISGVVAHDTFTCRAVIRRAPPWRGESDVGRVWSDQDDAMLAEWLQRHEIRVGTDTAAAAVQAVAQEQQFDSLQDYLNGLRWDGQSRLYVVARAFGNTSAIGAELVRRFLISAVARAMQPGCQADHVVVFEGAQGIRKSTALRILFDPMHKGWFRDQLESVEGKDASQQLEGIWCVEISELEAFNNRRSELERVKAFISRRIDSYRPPYGRRVVDVPRRNVFAGSTNDNAYLRDHTGNRRFWPLACGESIDVDWLAEQADQIWAEAALAYHQGEPWWIDSGDDDLAEMQEARRVRDPWEEQISAYVQFKRSVTVTEIYDRCLRMEASKRGQADSNRIARVLQSIGWVRRQVRMGGQRTWLYIHPDHTEDGNLLSPDVTSYDA